MRFFCGLLALLVFAPPVFAKSYTDAAKGGLSVKLGIAGSSLGLDVEAKDVVRQIQYEPHAPTRTFFSASYDWLSFTVSTVNPIATADQQLKGSSTGQDWQFRFNFESTSYEFFYQTYKGYYIENTPDFQAQPAGTPFLLNPDLRTEHFGLNFLYNWDPDDFSMSAAMDQSAIQTESGYGLLSGVSIHAMRFASPTGLVPAMTAGAYGEIENVRSARLYSILAGGGIGGTFVPIENWFLSGAILGYFGYEMQNVERIDGDASVSQSSTKTHIKLGFGYNGPRWMGGMTINGDSASYTVSNATLRFGNISYAVFLGRRFDL